MKELIEQLAEKLAEKYNLDSKALLGKNEDIMYIDLGKDLVEMNRHTHLSKCLSSDSKIVSVFKSINTLLYLV